MVTNIIIKIRPN